MRLCRAAPWLPGLNSPLSWGSLLLGAGFLLFGKDEADYNQAIYLLAISGVSLLTTNTPARCTSVIGGILRFSGSI